MQRGCKKTHRISIGHLWNLYSTFEHLSKVDRQSIEHLSNIYCKSIEHLWGCMEIRGCLWKAMEIHGSPWSSTTSIERLSNIQSNLQKIYGNAWKSMGIYGRPYGSPWKSAEFHVHGTPGAPWRAPGKISTSLSPHNGCNIAKRVFFTTLPHPWVSRWGR